LHDPSTGTAALFCGGLWDCSIRIKRYALGSGSTSGSGIGSGSGGGHLASRALAASVGPPAAPAFTATASSGADLYLQHHCDVVACLAATADLGQQWLVSGGGPRDCTVAVWAVPMDVYAPATAATAGAAWARPVHVFRTHNGGVNCVVADAGCNVVVSGSDDGTIGVHTLRDGAYLRSIVMGLGRRAPGRPLVDTLAAMFPTAAAAQVAPAPAQGGVRAPLRRVHLLCFSAQEAIVVAYSADGDTLCSYTINGRWLQSALARERLYAATLSEDGKVVLTGGARGLVVLRWVDSLKLAETGARRGLPAVLDGASSSGGGGDYERFDSAVRSLCLTKQERLLLVGLSSGKICVLANEADYLRNQVYASLVASGFVN